MSVDVIYQGLAIARNAGVRLEGAGLFIEMDGPMPVATELTLAYEGHRLKGHVGRIHEGVGSGIFFTTGGRLPEWIHKVRPQPGQTLEIEAEPELEATARDTSPARPPAVHAAEPAQAAAEPAQAAAEPAQASAEPAQASAEPTHAAAEPAQAAEEPAEAAPPASAASPPPFEATQEMSIPDDDAKLDGEPEPASGAPRPSNKKKKSSRKR